jgi:hypothetical protein
LRNSETQEEELAMVFSIRKKIMAPKLCVCSLCLQGKTHTEKAEIWAYTILHGLYVSVQLWLDCAQRW